MNDISVQKYSDELTKLGIAHEIVEHPELVASVDVLGYLGLKLVNGLSTLVFLADGKPVALVRRDDCSLDFDKAKLILGVKELRKASEKEFSDITGCPVGAVAPYIPGVPAFFDELLFDQKTLAGGSGSLKYSVIYNTQDLKKIPNSSVVSFSIVKKQAVISGKRFLSGITPSGDGSLHIGNYLGAVKQFIELSKQNETLLMVADLHGLTTIQDKKQLSHNIETLILEELSLLLGFLGDEAFSHITFFRQSDVTMHTELQSILNNVTPLGLLKRAHAYKDKLAKDVIEDDVNLGLFNYPILMAADILLYKPDLVPVGKDQKQHIEITRDIAERFNKIYKRQLLKLPEPYIPEEVATILGTDGKRKMSKSLGNLISIFEDEAVVRKQVHGTYTDPTRAHATDPGHVEGNMVFAYLEYFGEKEKVAELKKQYTSGTVSDVAVKDYLTECLLTTFSKARSVYKELKANPKRVKDILQKGQQKALSIAVKTMNDVRDTIGVTTSYAFFEYESTHSDGVISIDDFAKVELTVGKVIEASNKEGSEKLIRLVVNAGEPQTRIIFTAVRPFGFTPDDFAGKQFFFITNLAPRKMLDEFSQGMILAIDGPDKKPVFVSAEGMPVGSRIR